jgi:hypothetical protein
MSKSEKRHFKLQLDSMASSEKERYAMLFDAIARQQEYDEEALKKKLKSNSIVKHFPVYKKRLYDYVLSSLREYKSDKRVDVEIYSLMKDGVLMHDRSLYEQAATFFKKARKKAVEHEKWNLLLEIGLWEKNLLMKKHAGFLAEKSEEIRIEHQQTMEHIRQANELWCLHARLSSAMQKNGPSRTEEDSKLIESIMDHGVMKEDISTFSTYSKEVYYGIKAMYHFIKGEYEEAYPCLLEQLSILEEHSYLSKKHILTRISILCNLVGTCFLTGKKEEVSTYLYRLRAIAEEKEQLKDKSMRARVYSNYYVLLLVFHIRERKYDEIVGLSTEAKAVVEEYGEEILKSKRLEIFYPIAVAELMLGNYSAAVKSLNSLFAIKGVSEMEDMFSFAQLLNVIAHYELGHYLLLESTTKSSYRSMKKTARYYETERAVLLAYKKMANYPEKEKEVLTKLLKELKGINDQVAMQHFDFIAYIEQKLAQ